MRILSLGAGVQSSTVALMCARSEIEPVQHAIFADTQAEPQSVYDWLNWLESEIQRSPHPFPVHRVTAGNLEADVLHSTDIGRRIANPLFFTGQVSARGEHQGKYGFPDVPFYTTANGKTEGVLRRQCTSEYKISPIQRKVRELLGYQPRQRIPDGAATQLIGISMDEAIRAKPSRVAWITHTWPLLDLGMHRHHCLKWWSERGLPMPSKSACYFCPYHDDALWRDMKLNDPALFEKACQFDEAIRNGVKRGIKAQVFLHRSTKPLRDVDFRNAEDAGQGRMFGNECEGMCGV